MSVSSILSTRSTGWKIDVRLASLMDSIFAIGFGLGLRFVVDAVSDHDFKITGTLIGLWEGVIMLHFTKKMPKSSDPFIAYGVRLFVDFLYTESVTRLVLVLVWTALGMVLADVTPAIWYEVGLRRVWRRFRRDIYTMLQMIPTVAFFPPTRTVRFSPSREPSTITEVDADADAIPPPSVITTEQTPTANTVPTTTAPAAREILRRRVPGYFPADFSDTETELGSVRPSPSADERTSRRLSVYPGIHDFEESVSSQNDLDEENLSSASSASTERPGASSTVIDASTIPDMYAEEEPLVDVVAAPVKDEEAMKTPKQSAAPYMPPTPSDSAMHLFRHQPSEDPLLVRPPSEHMPQIPDFLDEANTEDWEKIQRQEATEEKPPTPPAKDAAYKLKAPIIPAPVPPQPQLQRSTPSPEDETKGWDMLDSQFISNPSDNNNATSNDHQVQIYDADDDDDMYGDVAPEYSTFPAIGESSTTELPPVRTTDVTPGILGPDTVRTNPWAGVEEVERQQREDEAARKRREEEDALKKQEEEEAEARRLEEERLKEKKAQEKAERLKKEAEDDAIRKKKREEDEAAERQRKEEAAEQKRKEDEDAAERKRREEEEAAERKRKEEEKRKEREEAEKMEEVERKKREKKVAKERRLIEAAEANHLKEGEEEKKRQELVAQAAQRKREAAEAAERREKAQQEAEKKRLEEEAEAAAAVAQALAEEEERKKKEEAEAKRLKEQQAAELKATKDREAAEARRMKEEAELKATKAKEDAEAQRMTEEAEKATKAKEAAAAQRVKEEADARAASVTFSSPEHDKQIDLPTDEFNAECNNYQHQQDYAQQTEPLSPAEPGQIVAPIAETFDEESAISEASARLDSVRDRLGKLLLLRAQMAAVGNEIADLKDQLQSADGESSVQQEQELRQREKIMRKMQRKETRKYAGLTESPQFLNAIGDDDESISLENLAPRNAEKKIEEKLEELLKPETKSITLTIHAGRGKAGGKIKTNVRDMLFRYNLIPYTTNDKSNDKISHVRIPEEDFAQWLLDYRAQVTRADEEEEEGLWSQYVRR